MSKTRVLIMGAAGRDFHNFNIVFRDNDALRGRGLHRHPDPQHRGPPLSAELAGELYPEAFRSIPKANSRDLIRELERRPGRLRLLRRPPPVRDEQGRDRARRRRRLPADGAQGHHAARPPSRWSPSAPCAPAAASRRPRATWPNVLQAMGKKVVAVRHPMPYGDLVKQRVQRFATYDDLDRHECTIEEREEYEPHIDRGVVVYAGVDYEAILRQAEQEADVVLWDGGNNDLPFYKPDLHIVVADPHRAGPRAHLLSGRGQPPHGRRHRDQQGRHRRPGAVSAVRDSAAAVNPGRWSSRPPRRSSCPIPARSAASACW